MVELSYFDDVLQDFVIIQNPTDIDIIQCVQSRNTKKESELELEFLAGNYRSRITIIKGKNITSISKGQYFRYLIFYFPPINDLMTLRELQDHQCQENGEIIRFYFSNGESKTRKKPQTVAEEYAIKLALHFTHTGKIIKTSHWNCPIPDNFLSIEENQLL